MIKEKTNKFFAYIRVSTKDQERGASLDEQLRQIYGYAQSQQLEIVKEFREVQSASKIGRVEFAKMTRELEKDKSIMGVIFHTVDRSARNPYDQAKLYELKQAGYELHFAVDRISSNNHSSMGMIFIRWGVASMFSEDLKEHTKKGILGRLHEGKYPSRAPFGYLDKTEAEKIGIKNVEAGIKVIDPARGHLIKKAFEIYSSGEYTVQNLNKILTTQGLTNKSGHPLHWKMLYKVLRNTFYYGYIKHNDILYKGIHVPLITKSLFDRVQLAIEGKANKSKKIYFYLFQGLVNCGNCGKPMRSITAKKRYKYFYCRGQDCGYGNSVQQQEVENLYLKKLEAISFLDEEVEAFKAELKSMRSELFETKETQKKAIEFELTKAETRLNNLLNQMFDNALPEEIYKVKKNEYLNAIASLREQRSALEKVDSNIFNYLEELGKLLKNPTQLYQSMNLTQKRGFVKAMVENFTWDGNGLSLAWKKPFDLIAERPISDDGSATGSRTPLRSLKSCCPNR